MYLCEALYQVSAMVFSGIFLLQGALPMLLPYITSPMYLKALGRHAGRQAGRQVGRQYTQEEPL